MVGLPLTRSVQIRISAGQGKSAFVNAKNPRPRAAEACQQGQRNRYSNFDELQCGERLAAGAGSREQEHFLPNRPAVQREMHAQGKEMECDRDWVVGGRAQRHGIVS